MSRASSLRPAFGAAKATAPRFFSVAAVLSFLWLIGWIWISWPYMLDDALIHLRYASFLLQQHRVTYDGVHASFGTSSLFYVSLLAALRAIWTSPLLPRVVSSVVYVTFFLTLTAVLYRNVRREQPQPLSFWLLAIAMLLVFVAPSAVRWMDDGMETGLVFLDALVGVLVLRRLVRSVRLTSPVLAGAFVWGLLTVLLRVELLLLAGCVSLTIALEIFAGSNRRVAVEHKASGVAAACMPLLGGLAASALIVLTMHSLLPDTAVAKAYGAADWESTFEMTAVTVVSSFSFGLGLLLLWCLSLVALLAWDRVQLADLPANLLFPSVLFLSAVRGQQIQGIRYFGWTLLFPLLWNLLRVCEAEKQRVPSLDAGLRWSLALLLAALLPAFAWETPVFARLFAGRVTALQTFQSEPALAALHGQLGIAEDVGFVGYFTQGDICDPYGLVNGRAAAKLTYTQRLEHCMALHPRFAFGSHEFLKKVTFDQPLTGWMVCGSYPFDNVRTHDVHFLAVAPGLAEKACPGSAQPISRALPGLL